MRMIDTDTLKQVLRAVASPARLAETDFASAEMQESATGRIQMITTSRPPISEDNRKRREAAVNSARASVRLEGFIPSAADEEHGRRFINGDINLAEFLNSHNWSSL